MCNSNIFSGLDVLKEIGTLQEDYKSLRLRGKLSKKAICALVILFRDKYGLSDKDALSIARSEMHVNEMALVIEGGLKRKMVK